MTAKRPLSLDKWKHTAVIDVELQSGAGTVRQRPGTLPQAIRGGRVPNPLVPMAVRVEYEGIEPTKLTPEEAAQFEDFKNWYVAETVNEGGNAFTLTPEDVAELPHGDREQLWINALHMFPGLGDLFSLMDLTSFRDRLRGTEAPSDGEGRGSTPE